MGRIATLVLAALLLPLAATAAEGEFSFYGLRPGMSRADVAQLVELQGDVVRKPGHGMTELQLGFDREDVLMEIRASWPRPEEPFAYQGLQRALREKFIAPVSAQHPGILVSLDEYANRAAVTVVFLSSAIRERSIDFHRERYLKLLE